MTRLEELLWSIVALECMLKSPRWAVRAVVLLPEIQPGHKRGQGEGGEG